MAGFRLRPGAGLTVATIAVPQAMAYATLAGLPPQYGLYTAIVMTARRRTLDSSRQLINGPTNAISISILSALALIPESDACRPPCCSRFSWGPCSWELLSSDWAT